MKKLILPLILIGFLSGCATTRGYQEALSQWKSHTDVTNWLANNIHYDHIRFNNILLLKESAIPQNPSYTYKNKSGVCTDVSHFIKVSLLAIDKKYNPRIVYIDTGNPSDNHYVCSFIYEGKMYIADYGSPIKKWTNGPFSSLDDYKDWLNEKSPYWHGRVRSLSYVWD